MVPEILGEKLRLIGHKTSSGIVNGFMSQFCLFVVVLVVRETPSCLTETFLPPLLRRFYCSNGSVPFETSLPLVVGPYTASYEVK